MQQPPSPIPPSPPPCPWRRLRALQLSQLPRWPQSVRPYADPQTAAWSFEGCSCEELTDGAMPPSRCVACAACCCCEELRRSWQTQALSGMGWTRCWRMGGSQCRRFVPPLPPRGSETRACHSTRTALIFLSREAFIIVSIRCTGVQRAGGTCIGGNGCWCSTDWRPLTPPAGGASGEWLTDGNSRSLCDLLAKRGKRPRRP